MNNLLINSNSKFVKNLLKSLGISCTIIATASCSNNNVNKINRGSEKSYSKAPIFMPKEDTSDEYDDDEIDEDTSDEYDGDKIDKDNFENSSKDSKQIDFKTSKKENSEIFVFSIWNDKEINEIIKNCAKMVYEKSVTIGDSVERLIYDGTNEKVYKELIFKIIDKFTKNICKRITYKKSYNELFGILDYIKINKENICKNLTNKTVMIIGNII